MTKNKILKEVLPAQQEGIELQKQEEQVSENSEVSQMLRYLAPWVEKTNGEESVGSWETTMATQMMVKLLYLWLTEESRKKVAKMLKCYHPLDRAAMAYALYRVLSRSFIVTEKDVSENLELPVLGVIPIF